MAESVAVRRLCLMVDIDGYSQNDNRAQAELQRRLRDVLDRTLKSAEVALNRTWRQDQGDGQLILLPVGVNEAAVVPLLIRGLLVHLDRDRERWPLVPLRLRASIVQGTVTRVPAGYVGGAVVAAARLVGCSALREELKAQHAALFGLIVSDDFYQDVLVHGCGDLVADGFRRVSIGLPDKEWHSDAWVRAWEPGSLKPLPNRTIRALRNAVAPVAGAVPETLHDVLSNPATDTEFDAATHETAESHEVEVGVFQYATEDHTYVVAEYSDHAEYTNLDYESSDFSTDSHDGSH